MDHTIQHIINELRNATMRIITNNLSNLDQDICAIILKKHAEIHAEIIQLQKKDKS